MGPYAAAAIQARRQLGIADQAEDLGQAQDDAVADLADELLLNWLETTTQPTVDDVNDILDGAGRAPDSAAPQGNYGYGEYGGYAALNEEEKSVCRSNIFDCWRSRNAVFDAYKWSAERYPAEAGHNDIRDPFAIACGVR